MVHWKANGQLSICINWTFLRYLILVLGLWGETCTAWLFSQGGRSLCTQILPGQGCSPSTILGMRKRHWGTQYWRPHPSAFTHFYTMLECDGRMDGRTDGQICRGIYSACNAVINTKTFLQNRNYFKMAWCHIHSVNSQHCCFAVHHCRVLPISMIVAKFNGYG